MPRVRAEEPDRSQSDICVPDYDGLRCTAMRTFVTSSAILYHLCACRYTNHCYKLVGCEEKEEPDEDGQLEVVQYVTIKNPHNSAQVRAA